MEQRRKSAAIPPPIVRRTGRGLDAGADPDAVKGFVEAISGPYGFVVMQPTTLCNMDCKYCYLPLRRESDLMSVAVAEAVARGIADQDLAQPVIVLWHGGEPLATGRERLAQLLKPFEELRAAGKVEHRLQTNATLIDDAWCDLFRRYGIGIGTSIDGPRPLNANRRDWQGRETFDRAVRGISRLKAAKIRFGLIAVVTPETITRAGELLAFVDELGVNDVGINIEERENANAERPLVSREDAERFWRDALVHLRGDTKLRVRELSRVVDYTARRIAGRATTSARQRSIPTISCGGDVVLTAPELAGTTAPEYNDFVVGNLLRTPLNEIIAGARDAAYVQRVAEGLANCQASCSFWDFCQGSSTAASRWSEHGDLTATETATCRNRSQTAVTALLSVLEPELTSASTAEPTARILRELAADRGPDPATPSR